MALVLQVSEVWLSQLADAVRSDKGSSRFFAAHPEIAKLLEAKYLHERLSIRLAYEAMLREFAGSEGLPCYDTVRVYLNSIPKPISILAREGSSQFQQRVEPYVLRQPPERVNQVWVSDHVQHDVWVRNVDLHTGRSFFHDLPLNAPLRPWMTAWMDWRSRKIVGAVWCVTPSSNTISSALRIGIIECGIPEEAYVDNGKDYRKVRAGAVRELCERDNVRALSPECRGVLARLNTKTTATLPYHAQSKPIESWFGNRLHERFDALWGALYCGTSPATRPEACDEALKQHRLFMEGKRQTSPLPAASEFVKLSHHFIANEYNAVLPHSGRGMNDRTPDEVFAALGESIRRLDVAEKSVLDALFWDRQRRRVREGGCIEIYSQRYEPADSSSSAALYELIERDILVACDPANLGEAIAMDLDGRVIGRMKSQALLTWGPISRDQYTASLRERRRVKRAVKDYIEGLSIGVETELDTMRRRAGVGAVIEAPELPQPRRTGIPAPLTAAIAPRYVEDVVADVRALMEGD